METKAIVTPEEACKRLGGVLVGDKCKIIDFDKATDVILDCMRDIKEKAEVWEEVLWEPSFFTCVDKLKNGVELVPEQVDKLREKVADWVFDAELEPDATVIFFRGKEEIDRALITPFEKPEGFDVKWMRIDPWRGYYDTVAEGWKKVYEDAIMAFTRHAEALRRFEKILKEKFDELGINWAVVISRTSNVLSRGLDIFVSEQDYKSMKKKIEKALTEALKEAGVEEAGWW
ncbi:MAG TPA: hypothetical protein ENG16_01675 [Archaeoglobus sp.]|nr:hypothetical protein [Archaeoglobus sp.]